MRVQTPNHALMELAQNENQKLLGHLYASQQTISLLQTEKGNMEQKILQVAPNIFPDDSNSPFWG